MGDSPNFAVRKKKPSVKKKKVEVKAEEKPTQLPVPTGYKLLIGLPDVSEKTEGGILKSADTVRTEQVGSVVGFVLDMGPDAYKDTKRFSQPYCKIGDFIIMRSYSGTRLSIYGKEFRIINDDSVEAVVNDPRGVAKV